MVEQRERARTAPMVREAVGVFGSEESLEAAIDELQSSGFSRAEISLLAADSAVERKLHRRYRSVRELEDAAGVPTSAYVSREVIGDAEGAVIGGLLYIGVTVGAGAVVASGGTLAAALAAAAVLGGGGALAGGVLAALIGRSHARQIEDQLNRGGLLLWVRTRDLAHECRATEILARHGANDVHIHGLPSPPGRPLA